MNDIVRSKHLVIITKLFAVDFDGHKCRPISETPILLLLQNFFLRSNSFFSITTQIITCRNTHTEAILKTFFCLTISFFCLEDYSTNHE